MLFLTDEGVLGTLARVTLSPLAFGIPCLSGGLNRSFREFALDAGYSAVPAEAGQLVQRSGKAHPYAA